MLIIDAFVTESVMFEHSFKVKFGKKEVNYFSRIMMPACLTLFCKRVIIKLVRKVRKLRTELDQGTRMEGFL